MHSVAADLDEIRRSVALFLEAGSVVELRAPKTQRDGVISGYFSDPEALAKAVREIDRRAPGIYVTLNPVNPALLARAENKIKTRAAVLTNDADVIRRRLLLMDFDPRRPAGISSTDIEHDAAMEAARGAAEVLNSLGWPKPVQADSGNGAHLLHLIDLPNDQESADLVKRVLAGAAARWSTDGVDVDVSVFNASRISKIYGSVARKGDSTESRPHRLSRILSRPIALDVVPVDLLRSFAAPPADAPRPSRLAKPSLALPFDVERWLASQGIAFERRAEINGSERWVLEHCPFNPSHLKPDAAVFRNAAGVLGFHCLHASCSGLDWRAFRNFIEPGRAQRREFRPADQSSPSPSDASDSSDEISIGAADVEAAADVAIAADDHSAAMRLIPELARLKAVSRVVIIAKLRQHFKKLWKDREFSQALAEAIEAQRAAGSPPPDDDDPEGPESTGPDLLPFPLTDAGNGERIVKMFGDQIRYCVEMKGWLVWDGIRWVFDSFEVTRQKGKQMCRLLYEQAKKFEKSNFQLFARASESYSAVTNALNFASTEPGIRITAAELDQHPNLLNCPNGVVNLRDGKILRHNKDFMITKLCPWPYLPSAKAERFIDFLQWAMGANPDAEISDRTVRLVGFLQRAFGYALTADVTEKAVFIFYGKAGNNGKTTLLTIFRDLLGRDYSGQIAIETVMATAKQQDATMRADLADLRGVRLVVTSEVEKESKLNEGKIKYITAGTAPIKSCRKYENPIEFWATHKLFMDCNHRPIIRGSEDAIWKRLKLVPFEVQIDDADIDKNLPDKLRTEMPGILAWAVRGCMDWMKAGLGEPPEVKSAGREWREHDDPLKEFLDDYCEVDLEMAHAPDPTDRLFVPAADLTEAYLFWAKQANEKFPLTKETLRERLESKGFWVYRSRRIGPDKKQTRTWEGLKLRNDVAGTSRRTSGFGPTWDRDG